MAPDIQYLIRAIEDSGLSRAEIAEAVGVAYDTIGRYLHGQREPSWRRGWAIMRLAESRGILLYSAA